MAGKIPIEITTYFSPRNIDELYLKDKNIVVIDVLRASTTIAVALGNGAKEIIPVAAEYDEKAILESPFDVCNSLASR